jgi:Recombinase/Recombinase zinc beta ribbon domain
LTRVFELYASGDYSLKALAAKANDMGLRHSRSDRKMTTSELHRLLKNPIYVGDFRWLGQVHRGSHEPLVSRETFDRVQEVMEGKGTIRRRHGKRLHPFIGLLTCARCGCAMTAEKKKGKYVYYRCTGFKGACGNAYICQERLADLFGDVLKPIQITPDIAEGTATAIRQSDDAVECQRKASLQHIDHRRRTIVSKIDRGYEDYVSGRISEAFWARKSAEWESNLQAVDAERARLDRSQAPTVAHRGKDFRTRETGRNTVQITESDRAAPTARNSALELHLRPWNSLSHLQFAVRSTGERERNWKLAEREGFEPSVEFPLHTLSKRAPSTTRTSLRLESITCGRPGPV